MQQSSVKHDNAAVGPVWINNISRIEHNRAKEGQNKVSDQRTENHISNISKTYHQHSITGSARMQEAFYSIIEGCRGCREPRLSSARLRITSLDFSEGVEPLAGLQQGTLEPRVASGQSGRSCEGKTRVVKVLEKGERKKRWRQLGLGFVLL